MTAAEQARALRRLIRVGLRPEEPLPVLSLDEAEWAQVAAAGIRAGVGPLLRAAVLSHPESLTCPEAVRARLRAAHLAAVARDARRRRELARVLCALQTEQVPVLVVKGAALAETVYPHPVLRPMHDVDILVRPGDRPRARAVLLALGYEDASNGPEDFVNAATGLDLDVHTELINATRLPARRGAWRVDLEALWGRAITGRIAGVPACLPHPVDHFVYLAQHLMLHHGMEGPLRFADLLALGHCAEQAPGWGTVAQAAREAEAGLAVFLALAYLREGFGLDIPPEASAAVAPGWPRPARHALCRLVLNHRLTEDTKFLFALLALPSWSERGACLKEMILPEPAALGVGPHTSRMVWRRRMRHVGRISHVLWGAARRALRV